MEQPVRSLGSRIKAIGELIKICGDSGVSELHFEEVHVIFNNNKPVDTEIPNTIGITPENNLRDTIRSERELREDQLSMALIENPAEYERLIAAGELEHAED